MKKKLKIALGLIVAGCMIPAPVAYAYWSNQIEISGRGTASYDIEINTTEKVAKSPDKIEKILPNSDDEIVVESGNAISVDMEAK